MTPADPVTAALTLVNNILHFAEKIYDDTPVTIRQANAENWAKFCNNIGNFILSLQEKINSTVKPHA